MTALTTHLPEITQAKVIVLALMAAVPCALRAEANRVVRRARAGGRR
jgi:hypothetical protein